MCVSVCVLERKRQRETERQRETDRRMEQQESHARSGSGRGGAGRARVSEPSKSTCWNACSSLLMICSRSYLPPAGRVRKREGPGEGAAGR